LIETAEKLTHLTKATKLAKRDELSRALLSFFPAVWPTEGTPLNTHERDCRGLTACSALHTMLRSNTIVDNAQFFRRILAPFYDRVRQKKTAAVLKA